jgi:hypothetical protein
MFNSPQLVAESPLSGAYKIRICDVFSTPWRQTQETVVKDPSSFDHTDEFQEFADAVAKLGLYWLLVNKEPK